MLKSWSIENFKAIVNSGDLKLAPVTILAGKNSSGKSSLLQSILMIAQTLSNQNRDLALLTNGDLAKLRTFEDILSDYTSSNKLKISFQLDSKDNFDPFGDELSTQGVSITFGTTNNSRISVSAIEASKTIVEEVLVKYTFGIEFNAKFLSSKPKQVRNHYTPDHDFQLEVRKLSDGELQHFSEIAKAKHLQQKPTYSGKLNSDAEEFIILLSHFIPESLIEIVNENDNGLDADSNLGTEEDFEPYILIVGDLLNRGLKQITNFFTSQIRYLGPFRAKPDITAQGFSTKGNIDDVGIEGEYAASVYHTNQNAAINWYNPHSKQVEQGTLKGALDAWVQYLGVAHQVTTEVAGLAGVTWKVILIEGQKAHTLPEVGVGLSQILPILVMGLLSPKNSLLIMEQPELHLHSKVQALLGDFFIGLSKCHKQCLIETHSENIVSQLRYHIVEVNGQDKSDCIIYFVDQDEKGAAKFEPIEVSPNGNILNWPDGFFDETMHQEDRITAASIRKRAKKAKDG